MWGNHDSRWHQWKSKIMYRTITTSIPSKITYGETMVLCGIVYHQVKIRIQYTNTLHCPHNHSTHTVGLPVYMKLRFSWTGILLLWNLGNPREFQFSHKRNVGKSVCPCLCCVRRQGGGRRRRTTNHPVNMLTSCYPKTIPRMSLHQLRSTHYSRELLELIQNSTSLSFTYSLYTAQLYWSLRIHIGLRNQQSVPSNIYACLQGVLLASRA